MISGRGMFLSAWSAGCGSGTLGGCSSLLLGGLGVFVAPGPGRIPPGLSPVDIHLVVDAGKIGQRVVSGSIGPLFKQSSESLVSGAILVPYVDEVLPLELFQGHASLLLLEAQSILASCTGGIRFSRMACREGQPSRHMGAFRQLGDLRFVPVARRNDVRWMCQFWKSFSVMETMCGRCSGMRGSATASSSSGSLKQGLSGRPDRPVRSRRRCLGGDGSRCPVGGCLHHHMVEGLA